MSDLSALLASAQDAFSSISSGTSQIKDIRTAQQKMAENTAQLLESAGINDAIVRDQKNLATIQTQNAAAKAGAIFGADLSQAGERISEYARVQQTARDQRMALEQTIADKQSVGFTDNPLQYIINQFTVNDDINKHNALVDVEDGAGKSIEDITRESSAVAQNQKNFEISITAASAKAESDSILAKAQAQASDVREKSMNYQADAVNASMAQSKDVLNIQSDINNAKQQQEERALRMKEFDMHSAKFEWDKQDRADKQASDTSLAETMQKGLNVIYGAKAPNISASPQIAKDWIMRLKSGGEVGKLANSAYMKGLSGILGGSAAQVIDEIYSGVAVDVKPGQEPILKLFENSRRELAAVSPDIKDDAQRQALVNATVNKNLEKMAKNIKPGDTDNVFNVGDVRNYLTSAAVASTPLAQKILAESKVDMNDPSKVYAEALRGVKEGKIKIEEAADGLATLYKQAVDTNLKIRDMARYGVALDSKAENVRNFKTDIQTRPGALIGGHEIVNMADDNSVKRALLTSIARTTVPTDLSKARPSFGF